MNKTAVQKVVAAGVICCLLMALVDGVLQPGYAAKSAIKILLFLLVPWLVSRGEREIEVFSLLRFPQKGLGGALMLGCGLYGLLVGGYLLLGGLLDLSGIVGALETGVGVTRENFLFVALYISLVNSFLEEFFFRGFLFTNLKKRSRAAAYTVSALLFSVYHTAMMLGWFSPLLFVLVLAALAASGALFARLNERSGNLAASWILHMFANFAINTVGFLLFAA